MDLCIEDGIESNGGCTLDGFYAAYIYSYVWKKKTNKQTNRTVLDSGLCYSVHRYMCDVFRTLLIPTVSTGDDLMFFFCTFISFADILSFLLGKIGNVWPLSSRKAVNGDTGTRSRLFSTAESLDQFCVVGGRKRRFSKDNRPVSSTEGHREQLWHT